MRQRRLPFGRDAMRRCAATLAALLLATPAAAQQGTLLIGNKGENTLSFVDLATGAELGREKTGDQPHEIAISPDGKRAAVVAYGGTTIDLFDVATRRKTGTIDLAPNARLHGLVWLPDGRLVATAEGSATLAIVAPDGKVSAVPTAARRSHMVAVTPDARLAYVANIESGSVSVIDLAAGRKLRDIMVGGRPEGLSLTRGGKELWVGDLSAPRVQAFDALTDRKLAEVAVDPIAIRVVTSPDGTLVATSNAHAGTVSLIDAQTRKLIRTIKVSGDGKALQVTILFSADGKRLYAAETGRNHIAEVDVASGTVLRRLPAGTAGDGLAIAP
jgi:YVTN family beta-propeller protein